MIGDFFYEGAEEIYILQHLRMSVLSQVSCN